MKAMTAILATREPAGYVFEPCDTKAWIELFNQRLHTTPLLPVFTVTGVDLGVGESFSVVFDNHGRVHRLP